MIQKKNKMSLLNMLKVPTIVKSGFIIIPTIIYNLTFSLILFILFLQLPILFSLCDYVYISTCLTSVFATVITRFDLCFISCDFKCITW